ncbi:MAG: type II toxin-antitoxin system VapC family toxin [Myxococcota bacterium]
MRLLLDTHALLWWLAGDEQMSPRAREAIGDPGAEVYVSAASAWEIATKVRIGKLPGAASLVPGIAAVLASQRFTGLPVAVDHAERAGSLAVDHRDPFDRVLVAQALSEDLTLVSNERLFDAFGVRRLW